MSHIRSKDTAAEKIAFTFLRQRKVYFQKHYKRVPGTPDIALPQKKKAVFIDSDFWHGKNYERLLATRPPDDYWVRKIGRNIERDREVRHELEASGWRVYIVWERDIKRKRTRESALLGIVEFLKD